MLPYPNPNLHVASASFMPATFWGSRECGWGSRIPRVNRSGNHVTLTTDNDNITPHRHSQHTLSRAELERDLDQLGTASWTSPQLHLRRVCSTGLGQISTNRLQ